MRELRAISVFCGSSSGTNQSHLDAARELGLLMAADDIELVYGGGATGLMGLIADTVLQAGGRVVGVIPSDLGTEVGHRGLTEFVEVETMHERKSLMYERSDAFIAMPGGFGTLDEFAEISTWRQLGLHDKPIGLLDSDGYYQSLLEFFDRAVTDQLLKEQNRMLVVSGATPSSLLELLRTDTASFEPKWQ